MTRLTPGSAPVPPVSPPSDPGPTPPDAHGGAPPAELERARYSWALPRRRGAYLTGTAGPHRLMGVDAARGLALIGMMAAHVGTTTCGLTTLPGLLSQAHGRSSILFATIAGFSLGIMSGRLTPHTGERLVRTRLRLLVRSALLLVLAGLTSLLATPVAIILGFYAAWLALAIPFLRVRPSTLFLVAAGTAVVGPVLLRVIPWLLPKWGMPIYATAGDGNDALVSFFLTGVYPGLLWMAFIFLGLGLSRLDWSRRGNLARLLGVGVLCAVLGYGGGWLASRAVTPDYPDSFHLLSPSDPAQCYATSGGAAATGALNAGFDDAWTALVAEQRSALDAEAPDDDAMLTELSATYGMSPDELRSSFEQQADAEGTELHELLMNEVATLRASDVYDASTATSSGTAASGTDAPGTIGGEAPLDLSALATAGPHSSTPFEALGSGGVAMAIIALMELIARRARYLLAPLAALGSMSLTAYCGHLVIIAATTSWVQPGENVLWALMAAGLSALAMAWFAVWSRGPLEHLVHVISVRATRASD